MQALLPVRWVACLPGCITGFGSVAAGSLLSLCPGWCARTCCAAPVIADLRARHASPGGAVAFWLGNTMLNPAALMVFMGFVLGWHWKRLVLGIAMVFGIGYLLNCIARPEDHTVSATRSLSRSRSSRPRPRQSVRQLDEVAGPYGCSARA